MIYTITLNPSIDYFIEINGTFMDTEVNRAQEEKFKAGGKGLNVSMVLNEMHIPSTAIALLGGFSGAYIRDYLKEKKNITLKEIPIDGTNRINVKIHNDDKTICINGSGPYANEKTKELLHAYLEQVNEHDWVIISGSYAKNIDNAFIIEMAKQIHSRGSKLIIDMESLDMELLQETKPYMIKPNLYEFSLLVKKKLNRDNLMKELHAVLDQGVEHILLSLGKDGALYVGKDACYRLTHEELPAVNKVGSGDSMLAAFIGKLSKGSCVKEALKWGGASGMAAVSTLEDVKASMMETYLKLCDVEQID